ncbi:hypothetical protein [Actinoplanes auranticolor]|uniref:Uncharacterized protein n=1 Tax=Actinoplanes auranticolor TaxID=47988 RepID=A0A919VGW2_9ACTN|nr:hypothetical protein [Actinoplanes auranticolor]GIM64613.1 hypothetical protein Aau02nite_11590 [Actinoplanes auranticolor]
MIATLRTADTDDITTAAALLYRAILASPTGRLLGSATTGRGATFADLLTTSVYFGRVDLAVSGERIDGVACWIDHPHSPVPPVTRTRRTGVDDLLNRLHTIDLVVAVPARHPHQHLACLGARPGHHARAVTDLLLHRQRLLNNRQGRTLYTEVHDQPLRSWLLRSGYQDHGVSLGTDAEPESFLLSSAGTPP